MRIRRYQASPSGRSSSSRRSGQRLAKYPARNSTSSTRISSIGWVPARFTRASLPAGPRPSTTRASESASAPSSGTNAQPAQHRALVGGDRAQEHRDPSVEGAFREAREQHLVTERIAQAHQHGEADAGQSDRHRQQPAIAGPAGGMESNVHERKRGQDDERMEEERSGEAAPVADDERRLEPLELFGGPAFSKLIPISTVVA